jgi:hypothetical protein
MSWPSTYTIFRKIPAENIFMCTELIQCRSYLNHNKYISCTNPELSPEEISDRKNHKNNILSRLKSYLSKADRQLYTTENHLTIAERHLPRSERQMNATDKQLTFGFRTTYYDSKVSFRLKKAVYQGEYVEHFQENSNS